MKKKNYKDIAVQYAKDAIDGKVIIGDDVVSACRRFLSDLERDDIEFRTKEADAAVSIMEGLFVHRKGEALDGTPLLGQPFLLQPFQIFITYNLLGFYYKGTQERRFKEAFIMLGRKNGKTSYVAALAFSMAIIQRKSGSTIYVVAAALKQACTVRQSSRTTSLQTIFKTSRRTVCGLSTSSISRSSARASRSSISSAVTRSALNPNISIGRSAESL